MIMKEMKSRKKEMTEIVGKIIKNAAKKQLPKKIYISKENNQINYYCTVCRYYVGDEMEIKYACLRPNFCPNCGQALDWSELKE